MTIVSTPFSLYEYDIDSVYRHARTYTYTAYVRTHTCMVGAHNFLAWELRRIVLRASPTKAASQRLTEANTDSMYGFIA